MALKQVKSFLRLIRLLAILFCARNFVRYRCREERMYFDSPLVRTFRSRAALDFWVSSFDHASDVNNCSRLRHAKCSIMFLRWFTIPEYRLKPRSFRKAFSDENLRIIIRYSNTSFLFVNWNLDSVTLPFNFQKQFPNRS